MKYKNFIFFLIPLLFLLSFMSYIDQGYNEYLEKPASSAQGQSAFDFQSLVEDGVIDLSKLSANSVGTLALKDASITSSKISNLSWDSGYGGTLNLGGNNNQAGSLSLKDENEIERIKLDKDGMEVVDGKISIKDENESIIIDSKGIVGANTFISAINYMTVNQDITGEDVFANLSGLSHTIILRRTTPVLFFGMLCWQVGGVDMHPLIRIKYNNSYFPGEDGWEYGVQGPDAELNMDKHTIIGIINLPAGANTVTLQAARSTLNETLTILGLYDWIRTSFGYLILGK